MTAKLAGAGMAHEERSERNAEQHTYVVFAGSMATAPLKNVCLDGSRNLWNHH